MWTRHWSKTKNAFYWHHTGTNQTTWREPPDSSFPQSESEEGQWVERFSRSKQATYWVNTVTNASTWTKPSNIRDPAAEEQGPKKRKRGEDIKSENISDEDVDAMQSRLDEERRMNMLPDPSLPRERNVIDMDKLVHRLHAEQAHQEDRATSQTAGDIGFRAIFTLPDEDVSHITRAIQEDEILKTRLKLKRRGEVVDLPSFWDVWSNPMSPALKETIRASNDPNEAKWACARQFDYKMATTFMPGYAKAIYQYFGATTVLDPCSGWGDRLLGASAAGCVRRYIGFDPNKCLRPGYAELLRVSVQARLTSNTPTLLKFSNNFQIHSLPFEEGAPHFVADDSCDLVFTSPPFFDYEMYNPDNPHYRDWLKEFYEPLFIQAARCVKPHRFVCIHIGDTSAGEIVPFLKNQVNRICSLQLIYTLGLTGVMSKKVREVWVFRNTQAPIFKQPQMIAQSGLSQRRKEWISQLTNPPIQPKEIFCSELNICFTLLDDGDHCIGGTKQRLLGRFLSSIPQSEIVYAGPDGGMAQVALAYTARLWRKKAVIFLNANSDHAMDQPLVKMAHKLGAEIRLGVRGEYVSLRQAEERAQNYVSAEPSLRYLSPFGMRKDRGHPIFELFRSVLMEALCFVQAPPKRMWLVSGSGFIMDVLHSIWPQTKFMIVQVGKKIWQEVLDGKNYELFIAPQKFSEDVEDNLLPTSYKSVPWYDAKLWQFAIKHGQNGDFIWNVAKIPDDVEKAVSEALRTVDTGPS